MSVKEEVIIISTEEAEPISAKKKKTAKDLFADFKAEGDDLSWEDQDDPFEHYGPPTKVIRKYKKRKANNGIDDEETTSSKTKHVKQKYKKDWENIPQFKKWLSESQLGPEYFYCKLCKVDAKCGKSEIMRHMTAKKHLRNSECVIVKIKGFEGLLCPVFTPIDKIRYEEINYNEIANYSKFLLKCNVEAVLVNDIIGEGMSLTVAERCLITEEWAKVCETNKQYLMVQVGGAPRKDVIRMVRHAVSKKVNALLILPDLYNKPEDHFDLLRYLKDVADHADKVPIWYHHYPNYTNVKINMKKFMVDVAEIETFVGVIFNIGTLEEAIVASAVNPRINIIIATEDAILGARASGFKSIMSASLNFLPTLVQNVFHGTNTDKLQESRESQKSISKAMEIIKEKGHYISALKSAMNLLTNVHLGHVRKPLVELWKKQILEMKNELTSAGINHN